MTTSSMVPSMMSMMSVMTMAMVFMMMMPMPMVMMPSIGLNHNNVRSLNWLRLYNHWYSLNRHRLHWHWLYWNWLLDGNRLWHITWRRGHWYRLENWRRYLALCVCHCHYLGSISTRAMICLLYTSPSPRDKRQSRMPSSA